MVGTDFPPRTVESSGLRLNCGTRGRRSGLQKQITPYADQSARATKTAIEGSVVGGCAVYSLHTESARYVAHDRHLGAIGAKKLELSNSAPRRNFAEVLNRDCLSKLHRQGVRLVDQATARSTRRLLIRNWGSRTTDSPAHAEKSVRDRVNL